MIKNHFKIPLYRGYLIVVISNNFDKIKEAIPEFTDKNEIYAHSIVSTYKGKYGYFIVLNFNNQNRKIHHGTITHESIHISNMLLSDRGIIADFNNDESQTYLAEWITDKVYKVINDNKLKVK